MLTITALLMTVAAAPQAVPPSSRRCGDAGRTISATKKATPRKLADEPPASQLYTVFNQVDGCPRPVVLRDGIGGNAHRKVPLARSVPKAHGVR